MTATTITETKACGAVAELDINGNIAQKLTKRSLDAKEKHEEQASPPKLYSYLGFKFTQPLKFKNIISIGTLHVLFLFAWFQKPAMWSTVLFATIYGQLGGFGVTGGAHRYWTHRSYKANKGVQILLAICFSIAGQNTIFDWVRDHRIHHKFSETDADPHNANRGFFFAHVGWLMMLKHPDVISKGNQVDMSDIVNDPLIKFHTKYFALFKIFFCFFLPTVIPVMCWGERWSASLWINVIIRYVIGLNSTWLVNSAAHIWGNHPYDKSIQPTENTFVSIAAMGEGWHNYHHVFPWDYKAAELGRSFNATTTILDFFQRRGWIYDCKQPSKELIMKIANNRGDGSHPHAEEVPPPGDNDEEVSYDKRY